MKRSSHSFGTAPPPFDDTEMSDLAPPPYNPDAKGQSNFSDPKVAEFFDKHYYPEDIKQEFYFYDIHQFKNLEKNALTEIVGIGTGTKLYNEICQGIGDPSSSPPPFAPPKHYDLPPGGPPPGGSPPGRDVPPSEIYYPPPLDESGPPPSFDLPPPSEGTFVTPSVAPSHVRSTSIEAYVPPSAPEEKKPRSTSLFTLNPNRRYTKEKKQPPPETKKKDIKPLLCEKRNFGEQCSQIAKSGSCFCESHIIKIILRPDKNRDWRKIPNVIGLKIFECLPIIVIAGISSVCKSWEQTTHHPILWKNFVVTMEKQRKEHITMITSKFKDCPKDTLNKTFTAELGKLKKKKFKSQMTRGNLLKSRSSTTGENPKQQYSIAMTQLLAKAEEHEKKELKRMEDNKSYEKLRKRRAKYDTFINQMEKMSPCICGCSVLGVTVFLVLIPMAMDEPLDWDWGVVMLPLFFAFSLPFVASLVMVPFIYYDLLDDDKKGATTSVLATSKAWFMFTLLLFLKMEHGWEIPNLLIMGMPLSVIIAAWFLQCGQLCKTKDDSLGGYIMATPVMCLIPLSLFFIAMEADMGPDSPVSRKNAFVPIMVFIGLVGCAAQAGIIAIIAPIVFFAMLFNKYNYMSMHTSWMEVFIPLWVTMGCFVCGIFTALKDS